MSDLITRSKTLFAGTEAAEGDAETLAAADAILASDIEPRMGVAQNERTYSGAHGSLASVPGIHEAGLPFQAELKGNGTTTIPELDEVLTACFGSVVAADLDTTISGTAGSATVLNVAAATNASTGSLCMVETATAGDYEVVGIITASDTGATPDTVTVSPGASSGTTPAAYATNGKAVKEMRTYQITLQPASNNSLTLDVYQTALSGGTNQRDRIVGARGTFSWSSPRAGQIPMLSFDFIGWSHSQATGATRPTPTYDTALPSSAQAAKFRVDNTLTNAFDISFDLGAVVTTKVSQNATNGVYGTVTTDVQPRGSFKIHPAHDSVAMFTDRDVGTLRSLLFQVGKTLYGTIAWYVPKAQIVSVTRVDDSGVGALQIDWVARRQDNGVATEAKASLYLAVG